MALFSRKTKKEVTKTEGTEAKNLVLRSFSEAGVLHNPRITEKASLAMEGSVYVFEVAANANKKQIMAAIQGVYKVKPQKVAIVNIKPKSTRNMRTGKRGTKGGLKKAYVYLKKGETITVT